jgi:hypothetical protein
MASAATIKKTYDNDAIRSGTAEITTDKTRLQTGLLGLSIEMLSQRGNNAEGLDARLIPTVSLEVMALKVMALKEKCWMRRGCPIVSLYCDGCSNELSTLQSRLI